MHSCSPLWLLVCSRSNRCCPLIWEKRPASFKHYRTTAHSSRRDWGLRICSPVPPHRSGTLRSMQIIRKVSGIELIGRARNCDNLAGIVVAIAQNGCNISRELFRLSSVLMGRCIYGDSRHLAPGLVTRSSPRRALRSQAHSGPLGFPRLPFTQSAGQNVRCRSPSRRVRPLFSAEISSFFPLRVSGL